MSPTSASSRIHERLVAPSILSADFARLGGRVNEVLAAGARVTYLQWPDSHVLAYKRDDIAASHDDLRANVIRLGASP